MRERTHTWCYGSGASLDNLLPCHHYLPWGALTDLYHINALRQCLVENVVPRHVIYGYRFPFSTFNNDATVMRIDSYIINDTLVDTGIRGKIASQRVAGTQTRIHGDVEWIIRKIIFIDTIVFPIQKVITIVWCGSQFGSFTSPIGAAATDRAPCIVVGTHRQLGGSAIDFEVCSIYSISFNRESKGIFGGLVHGRWVTFVIPFPMGEVAAAGRFGGDGYLTAHSGEVSTMYGTITVGVAIILKIRLVGKVGDIIDIAVGRERHGIVISPIVVVGVVKCVPFPVREAMAAVGHGSKRNVSTHLIDSSTDDMVVSERKGINAMYSSLNVASRGYGGVGPDGPRNVVVIGIRSVPWVKCVEVCPPCLRSPDVIAVGVAAITCSTNRQSLIR